MITREILRRSYRAWLSHDRANAGPWWLAYLWTLVFCFVVAAGFTIVGYALSAGSAGSAGRPTHAMDLWRWYQANLVISLCVGYAIHFLFSAGRRIVGNKRLLRLKQWQRTAYYTLIPIIGVSIGWPLGLLWALGVDLRQWLVSIPGNMVLASLLLCGLITLVFNQFCRIKTRQIQAESRATEAQLRLLQAQIEPHFLFNTLANVVSLMEADTPRAKEMLESFVDYLRASLTGLGQATHTLGDEIDLVESYLRILQIRMEDRLDYSIEVPAALRALPLPALTLQPLVENAIVHGVEPQIAGGRVRIGAERHGRSLVITVDDNGAGLAAAAPATPRRSGAGTTLANIRSRLAQTYGSGATLDISAAAPHGVRASLSLPIAP